jgi:hypothetical protein
MSWFRNLAIRRKLLLSFGLVILLMGGTLVADVVASNHQVDLSSRVTLHLDPARLNAEKIVTLVRAIDDDGAWAQGALIHDAAHAQALFKTYYAEIGQLRAVLSRALQLADNSYQVEQINDFHVYYFGDPRKPLTESDRKLLDTTSHLDVIDGEGAMARGMQGGYTLGNEENFVIARQHRWADAWYGYTTIPFLGALDSAQNYISVVENEIANTSRDQKQAAQLVTTLSAVLGTLAALLGLLIAVLIARAIAKPLAEVERAATDLATRDMVSLSDTGGTFCPVWAYWTGGAVLGTDHRGSGSIGGDDDAGGRSQHPNRSCHRGCRPRSLGAE